MEQDGYLMAMVVKVRKELASASGLKVYTSNFTEPQGIHVEAGGKSEFVPYNGHKGNFEKDLAGLKKKLLAGPS